MAKNRNRSAGHALERDVRKDHEDVLGFKVHTSRLANRLADNKGLDLVFEKPVDFEVQIKKMNSKSIPVIKILDHMDTDKHKVIIADMTEKKGKRFYSKQKLAVIPYNFYLELLRKYYE